MPFWVYGRDSETGQPADPFFSDATSAEEARAQAVAQGIAVEAVERHEEDVGLDPTAKTASPSQHPRPSGGRAGWFSWICLTVGEIVSIFGCVGAVCCTLSGLYQVGWHHQFLGMVESPGIPVRLWFGVLLAGLGAFCYSAAMFIVFSQAKHRK